MTALSQQRQEQAASEGHAPATPMSAAAGKQPHWTNEARWRRWALRLLGAWVLLSLLLVGLRVSTASIRPELRNAQEAQEELVKQRDTLSLEVQSLGSAGRITKWAEEAGMLRFADSLKRSAELSGVKAPEPAPPAKPLELSWQWGRGPQPAQPAEQKAAP